MDIESTEHKETEKDIICKIVEYHLIYLHLLTVYVFLRACCLFGIFSGGRHDVVLHTERWQTSLWGEQLGDPGQHSPKLATDDLPQRRSQQSSGHYVVYASSRQTGC